MSGHFALTAPVLGRPVPRPVHFGLPGPLLDDFAGFGSLLAHCARTGPVDVFSLAGSELGHLAQPALGQLARGVPARPVPVNLAWPPRLRIPSTRLRLAADRSRFDSDRQVQKQQQFRRAPARRLSSSANPECRRSIELLAPTDRRQAEAPVFRPT